MNEHVGTVAEIDAGPLRTTGTTRKGGAYDD